MAYSSERISSKYLGDSKNFWGGGEGNSNGLVFSKARVFFTTKKKSAQEF
jgi:hypothetical protein